MSIWFSRAAPAPAESRSLTVPWLASRAGYAHVDGSTIENAQQAVAVRSAVDLFASLCSELPIDAYSDSGRGRRQLPRLPDYLMDPGGDGYGIQDWIYQVAYSWLYRGNLYADVVERDPRGGFLRTVSLFHPDKVSPWADDRGRVQWFVPAGQFTGEMLHRRVNPVPGCLLGQSPITDAATTIGVQLASSRFGKAWFDADAQPLGILRNTKASLTPDESRTVKDRFMAALRGGTREPIVMGNAWEWQSLSVTPEESQFLGTMASSAAECARIFGPGVAEILGYETGGTLSYSNVQDRDIQLLKYSLNKWLRRMERLLSEFLPRPQFVEFNRDALLQTNTMQRYQAYALAIGNQPWRTVDEIRTIENLGPLPAQEVMP